MNRDEWIEEAEVAERAQNSTVCSSIINAVLHEGINEEDRLRVYLEDMETLAMK